MTYRHLNKGKEIGSFIRNLPNNNVFTFNGHDLGVRKVDGSRLMPQNNPAVPKQYRQLYADLKEYATRRYDEKQQEFVEELIHHSMIKMLDEIHDDWTYTDTKRWCERLIDKKYSRRSKIRFLAEDQSESN